MTTVKTLPSLFKAFNVKVKKCYCKKEDQSKLTKTTVLSVVKTSLLNDNTATLLKKILFKVRVLIQYFALNPLKKEKKPKTNLLNK